MNIGDYCRNKYGIAKVIDIKNNNGIDVLIFDKPICFFVNKETGKIKEDKLFNQLALIDDIDLSKIKHSSNIIDLIEVGDIITNQQGEIIVPTGGNIDELKDTWKIFKNIKSIVTREQFSQMEYKVKE